MKRTALAPMSKRRAAEIESGERRHLPNSTMGYARKPMKQRNPERLARLEEEQFGPYGDVIAAQACWVTGRMPVDRAHVLRDRSVGGGPDGLAALHHEVHMDFDDGLLDDAHFQARWGKSRADIRGRAVQEYAAWLLAEDGAA